MKTLKKYFNNSLFLTAILTFTISAQSEPSNNLPIPSELFMKHIEAIGGKKIVQTHTKRTIKGKLLIKAYGVSGKIEINAEAPNKMATIVDLGQLGKSRSGYNGSLGWSMNAMSGNIVLKGEALQAMIEKADFYSNDLQLGKGSSKLETVGITTINGNKHYRVLLLNNTGEENYLYFSKKTGLLSGIDRMELGPAGKLPTQIRLSHYKEMDGLKTARKISSSQNGIETIIEINSISYTKLTKEVFDLPKEIQAIVNK